MANKEHLAQLRHGVEAWNQWRRENPDARPDLSQANLAGAHLVEADLSDANLFWADLAHANLHKADFSRASLFGANLCGAKGLSPNNRIDARGNGVSQQAKAWSRAAV
jgi:uncharacterized protein YjbI with pentapeptide repeats